MSLFSGFFPTLISVLGFCAWTYLLWRVSLSWLIRLAATFLFSTISLILFLWYFYAKLSPWPDKFPNEVIFWGGTFWWAFWLTVTKLFQVNFKEKLLVLLALTLIFLLSATRINIIYGYYPTFASLHQTNNITIEPISNYLRTETALVEKDPVHLSWDTDTQQLDNFSGSVSKTVISGTISGFVARDAYFYFPAMYSLNNAPRLPILILLSGQPGSPEDWFFASRVQKVMDNFAEKNNGLTPIVVIPDVLGSATNNTLCVDSVLGNVDTYVSQDVPNWISKNLYADLNKQHWLIGVYSFGGTCALQFAA